MRSHIITSEPGGFADDLKEKERKRAQKALESASSFLIITRGPGGNDCISAMSGLEDLGFMGFNCHLAEKKIIEAIKEIQNGNTKTSS
jgi:hypothetical protein